MKKLLSLLLVGVIGLSLFTGCAANGTDDKTIVVAHASPTPHAEILVK